MMSFPAVSFFLLSHLWSVDAVLQTLALDVTLSNGPPSDQASFTMMASQALFPKPPDMNPHRNPSLVLATAPEDDALLCNSDTASSPLAFSSNSDSIIMMVPRGSCTFERKVYNAQHRYGAKAVLIYGNLASRYSLNTTGHQNDTNHEYNYTDIVWPANLLDYDCSKGQVMIPTSTVSFDPLPYNAAQNDPLLSGDDDSSNTNYCLFADSDTDGGILSSSCPSKACLLTGNSTPDGHMQACCAWDLSIWLYNDPDIQLDVPIEIPSAYITMSQAADLLRLLQQHETVQVVMYARWRPWLNLSSLLIWALGVAVAAIASYLTASDYRNMTAALLRRAERRAQNAARRPTTEQRQQQPSIPRPLPDETLELTAAHALGFLVMASASLLVLFYFKIYNVVKVFYALVCFGFVVLCDCGHCLERATV
jgi:hypothetical protein